jgi:hypothetical protein
MLCGMEARLRMRLGNIAAGLLDEIRSETYRVMAEGYNIGAGSKCAGSSRGIG